MKEKDKSQRDREGKGQEKRQEITVHRPPEIELTDKMHAARTVGIALYKLFETGQYRSPEEVQEVLKRVSKVKRVDVDIENAASYLLGALDSDDYDSELRGGPELHMHNDASENILRQAVSTLVATVKHFGGKAK